MSSPRSDFLAGMRHRHGEAALTLLAQRFAVLAQPLRLKLIHALMAGEKHVAALVATTGASQTHVSRQLQALNRAGILARRRVGTQTLYSLLDPTVLRLCELTCGSLTRQLHSQAEIFRS